MGYNSSLNTFHAKPTFTSKPSSAIAVGYDSRGSCGQYPHLKVANLQKKLIFTKLIVQLEVPLEKS
jgi:hypothetical protein